MIARGRQPFDLATKVRLGFALVTMLYAALAGRFVDTLPWALLVVGLDLATVGVLTWSVHVPRGRDTLVWVLLAASALSAGMAFNVIGTPAAALSFIPAYHAGLIFGRLGFLVAATICAVAGGLAQLLGRDAPYPGAGTPQFLMWLLTTTLLGVLGTWSAKLDQPTTAAMRRAAEARQLLARLQDLAEEEQSGFDAPSVASVVLERLAEEVPHDRSVVLVRDGSGRRAVGTGRPVARCGQGSGDVPDSLLDGGRRTFDLIDELGEHLLLVIPLARTGDGPQCGIVLDRPGPDGFDRSDLLQAQRLADEVASQLEVALLFEALREVAVVEERRRLAREMHDGIAQDLAALGFRDRRCPCSRQAGGARSCPLWKPCGTAWGR